MRCLTLKPRSQAFTIVLLHVCFPLEWKGGHGGSQAVLRQGMWRKRCDPSGGGGQNPSLEDYCERQCDSRKLIQCFIESSLHLVLLIPLLLCFYSCFHQSHAELSQPLFPTIKTPKTFGSLEIHFLLYCISFPSPCSHLHLIKTSETTLKSLGA